MWALSRHLRARPPGRAPAAAVTAPNPTSVGRSRTTLVKLKAIVKTLAPITGGTVTAQLSPPFMMNALNGGQTSLNIGSMAASTKSTFKLPAVQVRRTVVPDGDTLAGMTAWSLKVGTKGWSGHAQGDVSLGGGYLVYSDDPEYIANDTEVTEPDGARVAGGPDVEGVLYAERDVRDVLLAGPRCHHRGPQERPRCRVVPVRGRTAVQRQPQGTFCGQRHHRLHPRRQLASPGRRGHPRCR